LARTRLVRSCRVGGCANFVSTCFCRFAQDWMAYARTQVPDSDIVCVRDDSYTYAVATFTTDVL
jgi:hypothetical protein